MYGDKKRFPLYLYIALIRCALYNATGPPSPPEHTQICFNFFCVQFHFNRLDLWFETQFVIIFN